MRKFELTSEFITVFGKKLFRIKSLISFGDVKEGDLGGYIEKEGNLNQSGNAWVSGDADYATVHGFGSEYRTTTFYKTKNGEIGVKCGCFYGNLKEFREKVKETHGDSKKAKEYLLIADLMEFRFSEEKTDDK